MSNRCKLVAENKTVLKVIYHSAEKKRKIAIGDKPCPARDIWGWNEVSRYFSVAEKQIDSLWNGEFATTEVKWQLTEHVLMRITGIKCWKRTMIPVVFVLALGRITVKMFAAATTIAKLASRKETRSV